MLVTIKDYIEVMMMKLKEFFEKKERADVQRSSYISKRQDDFIKRRNVNFSLLVRRAIEELMEGEH